MKPVLTATEYKSVDEAYDGDVAAAMERAGMAVALAAARHGAGYGQRVIVLAGPGNNGGDGYVAARLLRRRGAAVEVHRLGKPKTPLAAEAAQKALAEGVPVVELAEPVQADLIIDALFGGGSRPDLPDQVSAWMSHEAPVIAVDYPTGLDPNTGKVDKAAFRAVETVTFSTIKTGHVNNQGADYCGIVTVADIGIEGGRPSMLIAEEVDALRPPRARRAHKWSAGAVLVVGGSDGMIGATVLAARSALNFGAGAVYMSSPHHDKAHLMAPHIPALALEDAVDRLDRFDVVVAGPGLAPDDTEAVLPLVAKAPKVLLDAGGLTSEILAAALEGGGEVVVTPHSAEFKRLSGVGGGNLAIRAFARKHGLVALLKGSSTTISDGGIPILVRTGGPELATIGTGDVLAGMISALWARGLTPLEAAVSGAYWHGVAASDLARYGTVTADTLAVQIEGFAW